MRIDNQITEPTLHIDDYAGRPYWNYFVNQHCPDDFKLIPGSAPNWRAVCVKTVGSDLPRPRKRRTGRRNVQPHKLKLNHPWICDLSNRCREAARKEVQPSTRIFVLNVRRLTAPRSARIGRRIGTRATAQLDDPHRPRESRSRAHSQCAVYRW